MEKEVTNRLTVEEVEWVLKQSSYIISDAHKKIAAQLLDTMREVERLRKALEWYALPNSGGGTELAINALNPSKTSEKDKS